MLAFHSKKRSAARISLYFCLNSEKSDRTFSTFQYEFGVYYMKILITGGCGYLGKTISYAFTDNGYECVVLDIAADPSLQVPNVYFYKGDIADLEILKTIVSEHPDISVAIHCAELSSVALSVENPYEYYTINVVKTMEFYKNLQTLGLKKIIFSSSAAVYAHAPGYMVTEQSPIRPRSPFGRTKYITEMILRDFCIAYGMKCISLRYFNPLGADPRTRCGSIKTSSNIISRLIRVLNCEDPAFIISGND